VELRCQELRCQVHTSAIALTAFPSHIDFARRAQRAQSLEGQAGSRIRSGMTAGIMARVVREPQTGAPIPTPPLWGGALAGVETRILPSDTRHPGEGRDSARQIACCEATLSCLDWAPACAGVTGNFAIRGVFRQPVRGSDCCSLVRSPSLAFLHRRDLSGPRALFLIVAPYPSPAPARSHPYGVPKRILRVCFINKLGKSVRFQ
jgi:hypothetical protein